LVSWGQAVNLTRLCFAIAGILISCAWADIACAQTVEQEALEQQGLTQGSAPTGKWDVTLGAGIASVPDYPGASKRKARFTPLFAIDYDTLVFIGAYGLGVNAIRVDGFRAGPVLGYEGGRRESSDILLTGLGDIQPSLTAGAFTAWRVIPGAPFELSGTVRQAITHTGNGLNGLLRFDYTGHPAPGKWDLIAGPHLEFANRQYEQTWFGVTPLQSENSGLPIYSPGGGLKAAGVHASLTYISSSHFLFRLFGDANRLTGDAADSPIVVRRTQLLIGIGGAYHF
jgi:outer membrane scaffolding protein for murein synthesis (MipA/OmpV family)